MEIEIIFENLQAWALPLAAILSLFGVYNLGSNILAYVKEVSEGDQPKAPSQNAYLELRAAQQLARDRGA